MSLCTTMLSDKIQLKITTVFVFLCLMSDFLWGKKKKVKKNVLANAILQYIEY